MKIPRNHGPSTDVLMGVRLSGGGGQEHGPKEATTGSWRTEKTLICSRCKAKTHTPNADTQCELLGRVGFFVTWWTAAQQAPLSMGFSRQEYWSALHALLQGIFLTQGSNSPAWQTDSLSSEPPGKVTYILIVYLVLKFMRGKHRVECN